MRFNMTPFDTKATEFRWEWDFIYRRSKCTFPINAWMDLCSVYSQQSKMHSISHTHAHRIHSAMLFHKNTFILRKILSWARTVSNKHVEVVPMPNSDIRLFCYVLTNLFVMYHRLACARRLAIHSTANVRMLNVVLLLLVRIIHTHLTPLKYSRYLFPREFITVHTSSLWPIRTIPRWYLLINSISLLTTFTHLNYTHQAWFHLIPNIHRMTIQNNQVTSSIGT